MGRASRYHYCRRRYLDWIFGNYAKVGLQQTLEMILSRAWSLILLGEDRQYGGNTGYKDDPTKKYLFDSNVANHKQLSEGDLVLIRNREVAFGAAIIDQIVHSSGAKTVHRCPQCGTTGIKARKTKSPEWRCNNRHEFDLPDVSQESVMLYEARFGGSFTRLPREIPFEEIKSIALRPNDQISIEELDFRKSEELLEGQGAATDLVAHSLFHGLPDLDEHPAPPEAAFVPSMVDRRETVLRAIKERRGQKKFRTALLRRYGPRCVVTGCSIPQILEAAHIAPYRGEEYNDPSNGLLMRADIHTLFDLNLLMIEPESYQISVHPEARGGEYVALHGSTISFGGKKPSSACLEKRWALSDKASDW